MSSIKGTLSICRRAGMLVGGMDEVKAACRRKEARLVITASDLSEKSYGEISYVCAREGVKILTAPDTADDFSECLGKRYGILAVTDKGFAQALLKKLSDQGSANINRK